MAKSIKLGNDTYLDASGVSVGTKTLLNAIKRVRVTDLIGAMSAGDSGFRTLTATIPTGYKTIGWSVSLSHPGTSKFFVAISFTIEATGSLTFYVPYYAYGATAAASSDYTVDIICIKSEMDLTSI